MHELCLLLTYYTLTNTFGLTFETTCSIISEDDFLANYNIIFTKNALFKCNVFFCLLGKQGIIKYISQQI